MTTNDWCKTLGIETPKLEAVVGHREANTFTLFLVALLERGEAMTLEDVAARFEEAGVAERSRALSSLRRCRPGRPPVYRDGELYQLDPHDPELDLWAFRLGLRPPKVARAAPKAAVTAVPGPGVALTFGELDEAWKDANLWSWSAQRLAIAVLDAQGGPLTPSDVVAAVEARTSWHRLDESAAKFERRNSAIEVLEDGRWAIAKNAGATVEKTREALRDRIATARRYASIRTDPASLAEWRERKVKERAANAAKLARLSRALLVAYPPPQPEAVALLDVGAHEITTFCGEELAALPSRLAAFDVLGAEGVRALLRALGFDPEERMLAELGPPQKSKKLDKRGRSLKITTALLVQGSCGIGKPFGDPKKLAAYVKEGKLTKLRRRLEADAKSLYALYEYGRLHGTVRLRWGFIDERIPAPWSHPDEPSLYSLEQAALELGMPLEVVVGSAPGWGDPWSRARRAYVERDEHGRRTWLRGEDGIPIDEAEVQRARLPVTIH